MPPSLPGLRSCPNRIRKPSRSFPRISGTKWNFRVAGLPPFHLYGRRVIGCAPNRTVCLFGKRFRGRTGVNKRPDRRDNKSGIRDPCLLGSSGYREHSRRDTSACG